MAILCKNLIRALKDNLNKTGNYSDYLNAAILVPLIIENGQLSLLFEVRSTDLAWQPGEICFPGGRIEVTDPTPLAAALRETDEELGLPQETIQILGSLHEVLSPIGVRLYPFIGYLSDISSIEPMRDEVADVFTVPLEFLLTAEPIVGEMERGTRPLGDFPFDLLPSYSKQWKSRKKYQILFYKYKDHVIWGLTAQVLYAFLEVCKESKKYDKKKPSL